jgi:hypothetical protein
MKIEQVTTMTTFNLVVNLETSTKSDNYDDFDNYDNFSDMHAIILEKNLSIITLNNVKSMNLTRELEQKHQKLWKYLIKKILKKTGTHFKSCHNRHNRHNRHISSNSDIETLRIKNILKIDTPLTLEPSQPSHIHTFYGKRRS